eukprot:SM007079S21278  [mRNA]  locus=s7079:2:581:- [translate_table: standard]
MVLVARTPKPPLTAFDLPLLFVHEEAFHQPIFTCNNLAGKVYPVVPEGQHSALHAPHPFRVLFKEGGVGTFIPLFFALLRALRAVSPPPSAPP